MQQNLNFKSEVGKRRRVDIRAGAEKEDHAVDGNPGCVNTWSGQHNRHEAFGSTHTSACGNRTLAP